jgi:hypothetical protein
MKITFHGTETFEANYKAVAWCHERGISVGSSCAASPKGLMFGDYIIAKWRNLTSAEIEQLHGWIDRDLRDGPVTVYIKPEFEHLLPSTVAAPAPEPVDVALNGGW